MSAATASTSAGPGSDVNRSSQPCAASATEDFHGKPFDAPHVVDLERVAGALQVRGHRPAHGAEADEADLHTPRSLNTSLAISAAVPPFGQPA